MTPPIVPERPLIPTPAQLLSRLPAPSPTAAPHTLGPARRNDAHYWLDTNAGIAFLHTGRIALLPAHYGDNLFIVDDVFGEWELKADSAKDSHTVEKYRAKGPDEFARWELACRCCKRLWLHGDTLLCQPTELPASEAKAVKTLRKALVQLPPADEELGDGDDWSHRGEAASVHAATLASSIRGGFRQPPQVLITNDDKARKLAHNHGVAARTTAGVLREMVIAGLDGLTANQAWDLHEKMQQVCGIPEHALPSSPDYFRP